MTVLLINLHDLSLLMIMMFLFVALGVRIRSFPHHLEVLLLGALAFSLVYCSGFPVGKGKVRESF